MTTAEPQPSVGPCTLGPRVTARPGTRGTGRAGKNLRRPLFIFLMEEQMWQEQDEAEASAHI